MAARPLDTQLGMFLKELGASLRSARGKANMSLQGAADYLGVTKAAVGHWETGTNPIGADKLFRLARKYGTTVSALVSSHITRADLAALVLNLDVEPAPAAPAHAEPHTATGLPVSFVERRSTPPASDPNVKFRRGVKVITNPTYDIYEPDIMGAPARYKGPLRRRDDPSTTKPTKTKK